MELVEEKEKGGVSFIEINKSKYRSSGAAGAAGAAGSGRRWVALAGAERSHARGLQPPPNAAGDQKVGTQTPSNYYYYYYY